MLYEKPDLEELELLLEGSFLEVNSNKEEEHPEKPGEGDGEGDL